MKKTALIMLSLLLALGVAQAEKEKSKKGKKAEAHFLEKLEKIGISKGKIEKIQQIHKESRKVQAKLKIAVEKKRLELKEIFLEGFDLGKIRANCDERAKLRADLEYERYKGDAEVQKILSKEEWDKYIAFKRRAMAKRHGKDHHKKGYDKGKRDRDYD